MRFPAMPDSPGPWDLDNENPQIGSSVDIPPRPCHTTPDSHFGTEVSLYLERTRVRSPTPRCIKPVSGLVLTGFSLFDCSLVPLSVPFTECASDPCIRGPGPDCQRPFLGGFGEGQVRPLCQTKAGRTKLPEPCYSGRSQSPLE